MTITEYEGEGALVSGASDGFTLDISPKQWIALREYFATERRMPEEVKALVEEAGRAQKAVYLATDKAVADDLSRIIGGLAAALEAAYAKGGE